MNIKSYKEYMTAEMLMGPNSARILEELLKQYPLLIFHLTYNKNTLVQHKGVFLFYFNFT